MSECSKHPVSQDEGQGRAEALKRCWVEKHNLVYDKEASFDLYDAEEVVAKADHDAAITAALRAERVQALEAIDQGEVWSLFRRILEQGGAIQLDYKAGHFESYEHYSARLDEAARERADTFLQALREQARRGEEE